MQGKLSRASLAVFAAALVACRRDGATGHKVDASPSGDEVFPHPTVETTPTTTIWQLAA